MEIRNQTMDEERALYGILDALVASCVFDGPKDGESALKECRNVQVDNCFFNLRYPFWHVENAGISGCEMTEKCRAALWYDNGVRIENTKLHGIKALRECENVSLRACDISSTEFLWKCRNVEVTDSKMESEYPFFECGDVNIDRLVMKGKYSFQYTENVRISNSVLDTKDAFWHVKNVVVTDSVVKGEYLGWYSKNLTLVRCRIIGTQPLCYCKGLVLEDCTMEGTDFSFERSEVQAKVMGKILGVKNPLSGSIEADEIGELLMEKEYINPQRTVIKAGRIEKRIDA